MAPIAEWVATQFWATTQKRTQSSLAPTHLTQAHRREARGVSSVTIAPVVTRSENLCSGCGKIIQDRSASCARCAVGDATQNMLNAARIGRRTANSPEAQKKRVNTASKNALAQHSWRPSDQPAWLSAKFYSGNVQPLLASILASAIARSISVSRWYAGRVREGYRPHPRHWLALTRLVGRDTK